MEGGEFRVSLVENMMEVQSGLTIRENFNFVGKIELVCRLVCRSEAVVFNVELSSARAF